MGKKKTKRKLPPTIFVGTDRNGMSSARLYSIARDAVGDGYRDIYQYRLESVGTVEQDPAIYWENVSQ